MTMSVGIYLPSAIFQRFEMVNKVVAEGLEGSFALLPRHIDYISVLVPGILILERATATLLFAVDHGTLIKKGGEVIISTRNCVQGDDLATLSATVEKEFRQLDDLEKKARTALTALEQGMLRQLAGLREP